MRTDGLTAASHQAMGARWTSAARRAAKGGASIPAAAVARRGWHARLEEHLRVAVPGRPNGIFLLDTRVEAAGWRYTPNAAEVTCTCVRERMGNNGKPRQGRTRDAAARQRHVPWQHRAIVGDERARESTRGKHRAWFTPRMRLQAQGASAGWWVPHVSWGGARSVPPWIFIVGQGPGAGMSASSSMPAIVMPRPPEELAPTRLRRGGDQKRTGE